jgi:hypothetical protein
MTLPPRERCGISTLRFSDAVHERRSQPWTDRLLGRYRRARGAHRRPDGRLVAAARADVFGFELAVVLQFAADWLADLRSEPVE